MRRLVAFLSLLLFSVLILSYVWWGRFQHFHHLFLAGVYLASAVLVVGNHLYYRDLRCDLGFRLDNLGSAGRWFGGLTAAGMIAILLAGRMWGNYHFEGWKYIGIYICWAAVQQYLIQNFLRLRSQNLLGISSTVTSSCSDGDGDGESVARTRSSDRPLWSAVLTGALFGLYHLPNLVFASLTFLGAMVWTRVFQRVPNFLAAWSSHALLGCLLFLFFKQGLLHQSSVGYGGYRYDYYGGGVVVSAGYDETGEPFIVTLPGHDPKEKARVRVFTVEGKLKSEWEAFSELYYSGRVSAGDLDLEPGDEIAVSPGPGNGNPPSVKVFDKRGRELLAFSVDSMKGGWGASVEVDCHRIFVAPGPGPNVTPRVIEFDSRGNQTREWTFPDSGFVNSIKASGICEDPDAVHKGVPEKLLIWGSEIAVNDSRIGIYNIEADRVRWFETLPTTFGVSVTPVRLGADGVAWAVAPGPLQGYPPWIKILTADGKTVREFVAFEDDLACGGNLASVDVDGDGVDEVVVGEGVCGSRPPTVRILRIDGTLLHEWNAY